MYKASQLRGHSVWASLGMRLCWVLIGGWMTSRLRSFPAFSWQCHFLKMKTVTEKNNKCFWAACVLLGWWEKGRDYYACLRQQAALVQILSNLKARLWPKFWDPNHFTFLQITQHMVSNICAEICVYLVQVDLCPYKLLLRWFELLRDCLGFFFPKLHAWPLVVSRCCKTISVLRFLF